MKAKKRTPKVSVIIPVYNAEKTIRKCIDSLLCQTYGNLELVVVDDGSTDNTQYVVDSYHDGRIKYFYKKNSGVSTSRNLGIEKSTGEYVMFCDADDAFVQDAIAELVSCMARKNVSVIKFGVLDIDVMRTRKESMDGLSGRTVDISNNREEIFRNFFYDRAYQKCLVMALFIKKDFIIRQNIRFENGLFMMEDVVFYADILRTGEPIFFFDKPFYEYYHYKDSVSHSEKKSKKLIKGIYESNVLFNARISDRKINAAHFRGLFRNMTIWYEQAHEIIGVDFAKKLAMKSDLRELPIRWRIAGYVLMSGNKAALHVVLFIWSIKDRMRRNRYI